jgi:hypothetical protein
LFQRQAAGLLTYSFWLTAFPKDQVFSGIVTSVKSLQQRELLGICTRFPIEPRGTAYRRQRYSIFNKKYMDSEKKLLFLHRKQNFNHKWQRLQ